EAVGRRLRGDDGDRRDAVASEHALKQVALLRLRWDTGARARALHVDDDERQLDHHGQADAFALEGDAGAGGAGHAERATEGRADGRADGGNLVLSLEGLDAEPLERGKLVQDGAGRRNRVAAVEEGPAGELTGGQEAQRGELVAGDVAVEAGGESGLRHVVVL